jgi:hypothetical protein
MLMMPSIMDTCKTGERKEIAWQSGYWHVYKTKKKRKVYLASMWLDIVVMKG